MQPNIAGVHRASALVRERRVVPGLPELDEVLPLGGLVAGSLMDLLSDEGTGAVALALRIAAHQQAQPTRAARTIIIVDAMGDFYPQAAQAGVDFERLVVIRKTTSGRRADMKWLLACLDETLRSRAIAAVVARVKRLDGPSSHRLRVAAESGGGLGLFVRPLDERTAVSAAAVRLLVAAAPRELVIQPLRVRGGIALGPWHLRVP